MPHTPGARIVMYATTAPPPDMEHLEVLAASKVSTGELVRLEPPDISIRAEPSPIRGAEPFRVTIKGA